jgi:hypothetical protein
MSPEPSQAWLDVATPAQTIGCRNPEAGEIHRELPCVFNHPEFYQSTFVNADVSNVDLSIYKRSNATNILSNINCAVLCFTIDSLAFILNQNGVCWLHIPRPKCREKHIHALPKYTNVMVRKVSRPIALAREVKHPTLFQNFKNIEKYQDIMRFH